MAGGPAYVGKLLNPGVKHVSYIAGIENQKLFLRTQEQQ